MTPAHPAHPVTLLRLRDAIASGTLTDYVARFHRERAGG